jgi:hypothetical protein
VGPLPFPFDAKTSFAVWLLSTSFCVRRTPRLGCDASVVLAASPVSLSLSLSLSLSEEEEEEEEEEEGILEGGGLSGGGGAGTLEDGARDGEREGYCC